MMADKNSRIAEVIFDCMTYHTLVTGLENIYDESLVEEVIEYLDSIDIQWDIMVSTWPNETGGTVFCSWIENGNLACLNWDFHK